MRVVVWCLVVGVVVFVVFGVFLVCSVWVMEWGDGEYEVVGGGLMGVYYDYGCYLVDELFDFLGVVFLVWEIVGFVDNLFWVVLGEVFFGFVQGDIVVDVVVGKGVFDQFFLVWVFVWLYDEYVQVVV